jgi:ribosome-binding factor A
MKGRRVLRVNSLLKEVISEVVRRALPHQIPFADLVAITSVEVTNDLHYAKIFISCIGDQAKKEQACARLNVLSPQIAHIAMKRVRLHTFPKLTFLLDEGLEKQMRICDLLAQVLPEDEKPPHSVDT